MYYTESNFVKENNSTKRRVVFVTHLNRIQRIFINTMKSCIPDSGGLSGKQDQVGMNCSCWPISTRVSSSSPVIQSFGGSMYNENIPDKPDPTVDSNQEEVASSFFKSLIQKTDSALLVIDDSGKIKFANRAAENLSGYQSEELQKMELRSHIYPEELDTFLNLIERIKKQDQKNEVMNFCFRQKSGKWIELEVIVKNLLKEPNVKGIVFRMCNVSECTKLQKKLRASARKNRLLAARCRQSRESERKQIARELHDDLGQSVSVLKMNVELLDRKISRVVSPEQLEVFGSNLEQLKTTIEHIMSSVQHMVHQLRPPVLDTLGLNEAIDWLAKRFSSESMNVFYESGLGRDLPEPVKTQIFRICQEALNNAYRHSEAENVTIKSELGDLGLTLRIFDDGVCFDEDKINETGSYGLLNMQERANEIESRLEINTHPGRGTMVILKVPNMALG